MKVGQVKAWGTQVLSFILQGWQQPGAVFANTSQAVHNPGEKIYSELLVTDIQGCKTSVTEFLRGLPTATTNELPDM